MQGERGKGGRNGGGRERERERASALEEYDVEKS